ncbi:unnamed protein product [Phytophthora lilii]|uniref:Unnamed protein product n=1 Tax=Phytophthora lilii TaxID=2077276 RepID=A0A9W6U5A8_9STRA|nr:unnamed protein product [Phytophthora lilii]
MLNLQQESCGEMLLALLPTQLSLLDFQKENTLAHDVSLCVLQHPYILPVLDIHYSKEKKALLVVQPFVASGSIKDRIYQVANPAKPYDVKYRLENAHPLPFEEIAKFSRQILEALAGLRSKGLVCDHLRSTNVLVDDGNARLAEIYTPLLAIDRYKDSRDLTVSLEQHMDIDLLLYGQILYEMATGMELLSPQPEEGVLEMLAPEIAEVLVAIFYEPEALAAPEPAPLSSGVEAEGNNAEFDDTASVSTSVASIRNKKHLFMVDVEQMLEDFSLFAAASDVPPIRTLFSGFRLDSGMKSTIKYSMRINASRSQAHIVHYNDQEALLRARQRAERRVYEEKEKQQQRIQQLTPSKNPTSKGNAYSSKTIPSRRKTYRADSFRKHAQRYAIRVITARYRYHGAHANVDANALSLIRTDPRQEEEVTARFIMSCVLNEPAADMTLVDLETGEQTQLLDLVERSGKYTILTFYATWSKACEPEVELMEAFSKNGHDKLLNFVLVNLDQNVGDTFNFLDGISETTNRPRVCRNYSADDKPTVLHFGCDEVPEPYGLQSVPHTIVIDPQGIVRRNGDNFHWDDIAALLRHRLEVTDASYLTKIMMWLLPPITT